MADLCTVCTRPLVVVSEMACDCGNDCAEVSL